LRKERRRFGAAFKTKVTLEAIKEKEMLRQLAPLGEVYPNHSIEARIIGRGLSRFSVRKRLKRRRLMNKLKINFIVQLIVCRPKLIFLKKPWGMRLDQKRNLVHRENSRLNIVKQCDLLKIHRSKIYFK
jgi:hypothetical protein